MPELEQVEKTKVAGFVDSRYTSKDRIDKEEKELQELIAERDKKLNLKRLRKKQNQKNISVKKKNLLRQDTVI